MESDQDLGRLLLAKFTELWTSDPLVDEIGLMYTVRPTDGDKAATVRDDVGSSFVLEQHNVLKRPSDALFLDPVKRPVTGILQGRNKAGVVKPGHRKVPRWWM